MPCLLCLIWGCCGESESFRSLSMLPLVCLALVWPKISCSSHFDPLFNVLFFSFCSPTICVVSSFELSSKYEVWDCFCQYILSREQPSCCFCAHVYQSRLRVRHLRIIIWVLVSIFASSIGSQATEGCSCPCHFAESLRRLYFLLGVVRKEPSHFPPSG